MEGRNEEKNCPSKGVELDSCLSTMDSLPNICKYQLYHLVRSQLQQECSDDNDHDLYIGRCCSRYIPSVQFQAPRENAGVLLWVVLKGPM